jgi:phage tail-like protein
MRADLAGLPSPHPITATLPGVYQGQSFLERFCDALDEVVAPVLSTLDNLPAYLDVGTAPADFLPWLAYWLGMPLDPGQRSSAQREVLSTASSQQGWQGTARGVTLAVESVFGCRAQVEESGGADWSLDPGAPLPGQPDTAMVVRAFVAPGRTVDERRLDIVVTLLKPAHVAHRVEVRSE